MVEQRLPRVDQDDGIWGDILVQYLEKEHFNDDTDNAANGGHKTITIQPGTASAGTAPIKFLSSNVLMSSPEAGALETDDDFLYFTDSNPTRLTIAAYDDSSGAEGDMYYRDSSGAFTALPAGGEGYVLGINSGVPSWSNVLTPLDTNFAIADDGDTSKVAMFDVSQIDTATTKTFIFPGGGTSGVLVTTGSVQTLTNKTFNSSTNTFLALDTNFQLADNVDTTKRMFFDASNITTSTSRTYGVPDANTTLVGDDTAQTLTNKTLTAPKFADLGYLADTSGNKILELNSNSSAVNYIQIANQPTGVSPFVSAEGSDTDIDMFLYSKGIGNINLMNSSGQHIFQADNTSSSAANYSYAGNATTGNPAVLGSWGSDTDVDLNLQTKGTGVVQANGVEVATVSGTQTLTNKTLTTPKIDYVKDADGDTVLGFNTNAGTAINYLSVYTGASGAYPGISSTASSDTDIGIDLSTKGSGPVRIYAPTTQTPTLRAAGPDTNHSLNLTTQGSGTVQANGVDVVTTTGTQTLTNKTVIGSTGILQPVRVVAETGLTYTISAGTVTQIAGTTIAGVSVDVGDRVAVLGAPASTGSGVGNSNQPGNGIYVVTDNTTNISLTRSSDMSGSASPIGMSVFVTEGTSWGGWYASFDSPSNGTFTWGTTALAYTGYWLPGGSIVYLTNSQTLTNKRIDPRINSTASSATPSINTDTTDQFNITALATDITSMSSGLSGTPVDGQKLLIRIKDDGTARAITWGSSYRAIETTLPATTVISKVLYVGCVYHSTDAKWDVLAVGQEA